MGFQSPNYTMVPDELFDELLPVLSGAELKVLLYIIRRTFGFKRDSDTISINQMLHGIKTRDGRVLDRGVGLTKKTLLAAIRSLEERNAIVTQQRRSLERGNEPTVYQLNVIAPTLGGKITPPLGEKLHQGGGVEITPSPRGKNYSTQYTVEQETVEQEIEPFENSNIRKVPSLKSGDSDAPTAVPPPAGETASEGKLASVGEVLKRQGGRSSRPRPETETEEWQAIAAYIEDFARELGDTAPLKSSATRAYNLFQASGLPLDVFLNKLFQARSLTQESTARITKTDRDPEYGVKRKTKMAYFFAVLEDQLGLLSPEEKARRDKLHAEATARYQKRQAQKHKQGDADQGDDGRRSGRGRDSEGPYAAYIEH